MSLADCGARGGRLEAVRSAAGVWSRRSCARLLAACDRRTPTGRRDYAIVLLLSRLGLRAGEVARLGLGRHRLASSGRSLVVGKGNRAERLPLPADVGAAITAYLRRGRPAPPRGAACSSGSMHRIGR